MAGAADGRIRLTVLGGFLGSGKTTWLRHQLHHGLMKDALVVVNEAAELPVDDALLSKSSRLAVLAGGCACCSAREALVTLLREACDARLACGEAGTKLDHIVLETSGLADPGAITDAIRTDPVLLHHILVGEIVVAVDAVHGMEQLRRERLGRRQVETADRLVVTKVDAAEEAALVPLLATLKMVNPGAVISGAVMGSAAALPDHHEAAAEPLPAFSGKEGPPICAVRLDIEPSIDWTAFSVWLSALLHARGEDVMRIKGVVRTPAGRLLLQSVRRIVQSPEILPECEADTDNSIVVIGRGFRQEDLSRSLRHFARR